MAYLLGEATIRISANAKDVQRDIRRAVQEGNRDSKNNKIEIPVGIDEDEFERELARINESLEELEKRQVSIPVRFDIDDRNYQEAKKKIESLGEDQHVDVWINTHGDIADESMKDFHRKWNGREIDMEVKIKPPARIPSVRNIQMPTIRMPRVDMDAEDWNVINMYSKAWRLANQQVDKGIIQIYDKYRRVTVDMINWAAKPAVAMREAWNNADTFTGFVESVKRPMDELKTKVHSTFSQINYIIDTSFRKGGLKSTLRQMEIESKYYLGRIVNGFGGAFAVIRGSFQGLARKMQGFKAPPFLDKVIHQARYFAVELTNTFRWVKSSSEMLLGSLGFAAKYHIGRIGDAIKTLPSVAARHMKSFGSALRAELIIATIPLYHFIQRFRGAMEMLGTSKGIDFAFIGMKLKESFRFIKGEAQAMQIFLRKVWDDVANGAQGAIRRIPNTIRDAFESVRMIAFQTGARIRDSIVHSLDFSRAVSGRVINGLRAKLGSVTSTLGGIASGIKNSFSGVFDGIGNTVFARMGRTITANMGKVFNGPGFRIARVAFRRISDYAMGFSRIATGAFTKMTNLLMKSLLPAIMAVGAGLLALGGQVILGSLMAVVGALGSVLHAALLLAPGLAAAAGIGFGALKIGLNGVKEGVSQAFNAETVEDFEQGIQNLHPAVQGIARALREFKGPMDEMKNLVQSNMLDGLAPKVSSAMGNLFPTFSSGMQGVASEWNGAFGMALDNLSSSKAQAGLSAIMSGTQDMAREMQPVISNLLTAFGSLGEQAAKFFGPLGGWIASATEGFANWAEGLKEIDPETNMSKFDTFMETARVNLGHLREIFGGLFGTITNVFSAAMTGGQELLSLLGEGARSLQSATAKGTEGYASIQRFMEGTKQAVELLIPFVGQLFGAFSALVAIVANMAIGALPGLTVGMEGLKAGLQEINKVSLRFGENMGAIFEAMGPALESLGAVLAPIIAGIGEGLERALVPALKVLDNLFIALEPAAKMMETVLATLGDALGKVFESLEPILLSTASLFEPILFVLDKLFFWIGEIASAIVDVLTPVFTGHDEVIKQVMGSLGGLVDVLGPGLKSVIEALAPVFEKLGEILGRVFQAIAPIIPLLTSALKPAFDVIAGVISVVVVPILNFLLEVIVRVIEIGIKAIIAALQVMQVVFSVVWNAVSAIVQFAWNNIIKPTVDAIIWGWNRLGDAVRFMVENFVKPAFASFEAGLEKLRNFFDKTVQGIKSIWEGLKSAFAKPIRFVIETVINNGLFAGWNKVAGLVGLDKAEPVPLGSLGNFASGGVLGGYSPGRDDYDFYDAKKNVRLGLSGGEGILRPEVVRAMGGAPAIEAMNRSARIGGVNGARKQLGQGAAYATGGIFDMAFPTGGIVPRTRNRSFGPAYNKEADRAVADSKKKPASGDANDARIQSLFRELKSEHGKPYQYGGTGNPSWDCSGLWSGIVQYLNGGSLRGGRIFNTESNFASFGFERGLHGRVTIGVMNGGGGMNSHMSGTIDGVNIESAGGKGVQIGGSAVGSNHSMYNAQYTLARYLGEYLPGADGGGGGFNIGAMVKSLWDRVIEAIPSFTGGKGLVAEVPKAFLKMAAEAIWNFISSKIGSIGAFFGDPGAGVEQWRGMVVSVLRSKGLSEDLADTVLRRMNQESGGDARAINNWDSNASAGTPSKGLMQVIDPTFQAHKDPGYDDIWDPEANLRASLNYAQKRYGSIPAAYNRAGGYDEGGEARGVGLLNKWTIKPERVLSPNQTKAFNDFVYRFLPALINDYRQQPFTLEEGFKRVVRGIEGIQHNQQEMRAAYVESNAEMVKGWFRAREKGEQIGNPLTPLSNNPETLSQEITENYQKLETNLQKAAWHWNNVTADPDAYLAAEKEAIDRMDKEDEEARKKAQEEENEQIQDDRQKASEADQEAKKKEIDALHAKRDAELKDGVSEAAKEAIEERYKKEEEAIEERYKKEKEVIDQRQKEEDEALRQRRQAEEDHIKELKESGVYYYGYEVLKEGGTDPSPYKRSAEEEEVWRYGDAIASGVGLGSVFKKINHYANAAGELNSQIETVAPSWIAAMNGDYAGLNHNIAVAQSQSRWDTEEDAKELLPKLVSGGLEMAISNGTVGRSAPFIENVNVGSTAGELMSNLEHYQAMEARRRTGTTRMR